MRILQVRFKNLNSLVGEWLIDLTHPAYASDGIFAITGPTGAGKSTILDAICLALYGRTPRLNKVSKSGNDIMSRQTGECFAEVTFETQSGRFRCHWSQHRARRKPEGELQAPKQEIANADTGEIFESKIRGVANEIEAATGMDFDRFTRSMLLAQGGFAAFLQAAPDDRAPILEQITGTEIYSEISVRVHERQRAEQDKLKLLQAETTGIAILDPDQEREIAQALETKHQQEAELVAQVKATGNGITWLKTVDGLQQEIGTLADEAIQLQSELEAFQPERDRLARAVSAATLDGRYATLTAARQQLTHDRTALDTEVHALPELEATVTTQSELLKAAEEQAAQAKGVLAAAAPQLQKVRSLDQKLVEQQRMVATGEQDCQAAADKITADEKSRHTEQSKRVNAAAELEQINDYLIRNAQDEWLVSGLAGVEEQLNSLLVQQKEIGQQVAAQKTAEQAVAQTTKALENCREQFSERRRALNEANQQLQSANQTLQQLLGGRLLREYRTEKDALLREMALLRQIAQLEDHRARLEDGKPCPLCGSHEHPYAEGQVPVADETEQKISDLTRLIAAAEDQEAAIVKLGEVVNQASNALTEAERLGMTAAHEQQNAEQALAEANASLAKLNADFAERRKTVSERLQPLGIHEIRDTNIASLRESLRERLATWQSKISEKTAIEKRLADIDGEVKRLGAVIDIQQAALAGQQQRLNALKAELAAAREERRTLYGDRNPDVEEHGLQQAMAAAENAEKQAREHYHHHQQQWHTAKTRVESLQQRIAQREPELRDLQTTFASALAPLGFADEEQFLAAILPPSVRADLLTAAQTLDERQSTLKTRKSDREARLATELARKVTDKSLEDLELSFQQQEAALQESRDIITGFKHQLTANTAAKARIREQQAAIDAQKKECLRWGNLHELIGSADGKKYRNFAQGLTFEMMIGHANRQLQKMTDRYLLVRDAIQPLELNVVDNYQAGEVRTTKNLSGGESFIVSLSLALGLSQMASKNVRVDSLFLDEGFGTLDEEALNTALETLAGLQQDGKLIGVISHVSALKERISTQIQITPQSGGCSQISGPGCGRAEII